jgi:hypothetical protein
MDASTHTTDRGPVARWAALQAVSRSVVRTGLLLLRRRLRLGQEHLGSELGFADGTSGRVYRETVLDGAAPADPCVLVVTFRLRWVRGHGHAAFRWESLLNTPLFVGFPGFVSKLWLTEDARGRYRGVYEWDGPQQAEQYARALWRVLALVSAAGSIDYKVLAGVTRDEVLEPAMAGEPLWAPAEPAEVGANPGAWWRVIGAA